MDATSPPGDRAPGPGDGARVIGPGEGGRWRGRGLDGVALGELVVVRPGRDGDAGGRAIALVIGLVADEVELAPLRGRLAPGDPIAPAGSLRLPTGAAWLGRRVDPLGAPIDGGPSFDAVPENMCVWPSKSEALIRGGRLETGVLLYDLGAARALGDALLIRGGEAAERSGLAAAIAGAARARGRAIVVASGDESRWRGDCRGEGVGEIAVVSPGPEAAPLGRALAPWSAISIGAGLRVAGRDAVVILDPLPDAPPPAWTRWRGEGPATAIERLVDAAGARRGGGSLTLIACARAGERLPAPLVEAFDGVLEVERWIVGRPPLPPSSRLRLPVAVERAGPVVAGIAAALLLAEEAEDAGAPPASFTGAAARGLVLREALRRGDEAAPPSAIESLCLLVAFAHHGALDPPAAARLRSRLLAALRGEHAELMAAIAAGRLTPALVDRLVALARARSQAGLP